MCVFRERVVSVKFRSVVSVRHVGRFWQGKGGLVTNASQKASQIPFFEYQNIRKIANRPLFNIHLLYTKSESSNTLEN